MSALLRRLFYARPVNTALRTLLRRAPVPTAWQFGVAAPVRVDLPGAAPVTVASNETDHVAKRLFWGGAAGYEPHLWPLLTRLDLAGRAFVDVGAHVGYVSLVVGRFHPRTRIVCAEPNPAALHFLRRNLADNDIAATVVEAALADAPGTATFQIARAPKFDYLDHHLSGSNSLSALDERHAARPLDVRLTTLDDLAGDLTLPPLGLVKIDAEGAEARVLAGGAARIAADRPVVIVEVDPGETEALLLDFAARHDYAILSARADVPGGLVAVEAFTPHNATHHDFALVPREAVADVLARVRG